MNTENEKSRGKCRECWRIKWWLLVVRQLVPYANFHNDNANLLITTFQY